MSEHSNTEGLVRIEGSGGLWQIDRIHGGLPDLAGDGVTDDTDALAVWIEAAQRIPAGVYRIERAIEIEARRPSRRG